MQRTEMDRAAQAAFRVHLTEILEANPNHWLSKVLIDPATGRLWPAGGGEDVVFDLPTVDAGHMHSGKGDQAQFAVELSLDNRAGMAGENRLAFPIKPALSVRVGDTDVPVEADLLRFLERDGLAPPGTVAGASPSSGWGAKDLLSDETYARLVAKLPGTQAERYMKLQKLVGDPTLGNPPDESLVDEAIASRAASVGGQATPGAQAALAKGEAAAGDGATDAELAARGSGVRPGSRGFVSIGGILFTLIVVGSAVYVYNTAEDKVSAMSEFTAETLLGLAGAATAEELGALIGQVGMGGLFGAVTMVLPFPTDSPISEWDLRNLKTDEFLRDAGFAEEDYSESEYQLLRNQAYQLLFETVPLVVAPGEQQSSANEVNSAYVDERGTISPSNVMTPSGPAYRDANGQIHWANFNVENADSAQREPGDRSVFVPYQSDRPHGDALPPPDPADTPHHATITPAHSGAAHEGKAYDGRPHDGGPHDANPRDDKPHDSTAPAPHDDGRPRDVIPPSSPGGITPTTVASPYGNEPNDAKPHDANPHDPTAPSAYDSKPHGQPHGDTTPTHESKPHSGNSNLPSHHADSSGHSDSTPPAHRVAHPHNGDSHPSAHQAARPDPGAAVGPTPEPVAFSAEEAKHYEVQAMHAPDARRDGHLVHPGERSWDILKDGVLIGRVTDAHQKPELRLFHDGDHTQIQVVVPGGGKVETGGPADLDWHYWNPGPASSGDQDKRTGPNGHTETPAGANGSSDESGVTAAGKTDQSGGTAGKVDGGGAAPAAKLDGSGTSATGDATSGSATGTTGSTVAPEPSVTLAAAIPASLVDGVLNGPSAPANGTAPGAGAGSANGAGTTPDGSRSEGSGPGQQHPSAPGPDAGHAGATIPQGDARPAQPGNADTAAPTPDSHHTNMSSPSDPNHDNSPASGPSATDVHHGETPGPDGQHHADGAPIVTYSSDAHPSGTGASDSSHSAHVPYESDTPPSQGSDNGANVHQSQHTAHGSAPVAHESAHMTHASAGHPEQIAGAATPSPTEHQPPTHDSANLAYHSDLNHPGQSTDHAGQTSATTLTSAQQQNQQTGSTTTTAHDNGNSAISHATSQAGDAHESANMADHA